MASAEKAKVMNNEKTSSVDLEINEKRKEECVIILMSSLSYLESD